MTRSWGYYTGAVLLLCFTTWHVLKIVLGFIHDPANAGIDFYAYYATSQSLLEGKNPFQAENLPFTEKWSILPIVFPPQMVLLAPFALVSPETSQLLFFTLNLAATCGLFLF